MTDGCTCRAPLRPAGGLRRIGSQPEHVCGQTPLKNGPSSWQHSELNPIPGTLPSDQGARKVADSLIEARVREAGTGSIGSFPKLDNIWSGRRDQIPPGACNPTRPVKQALQEGELVVGEDQGSAPEARLPSMAHWTFKAGTLDRASSTPDPQRLNAEAIRADRGRRVSHARAR